MAVSKSGLEGKTAESSSRFCGSITSSPDTETPVVANTEKVLDTLETDTRSRNSTAFAADLNVRMVLSLACENLECKHKHDIIFL